MSRRCRKFKRDTTCIRKKVVLVVTADWELSADTVQQFCTIDLCKFVIRFFRTQQKNGLERIVKQYLKENEISTTQGDRVIFWERMLKQKGGDAYDL